MTSNMIPWILFLIPFVYAESLNSESATTVNVYRLNDAFPALSKHTFKPVANASPRLAASGENRLAVMESSRRNPITQGVTANLETHFNKTFEWNIWNLPFQALLPVAPWTSTYWPSYEDGINSKSYARGVSMSPSEKYARAFGLNITLVQDSISMQSGIDMLQGQAKNCRNDDQCNSGEKCGKREGRYEGLCVPEWYGICHAWAPASILEKEPKCSIQYNGILFTPMDIKGLLTQIYDNSNLQILFGGSRCSEANIETDNYGRAKNSACRDLTPDFLHVMLTNLVGLWDSSFIVDIYGGAEVWNQAVVGFTVQEAYIIFSKEDAAKKIDPSLETYPFNDEAVSFAYFKTDLHYVHEAIVTGPSSNDPMAYARTMTLEYLLELNENYDIIGGEWLGSSKIMHPDFLWFPRGKMPSNYVGAGFMRYENIQTLLRLSVEAQC